MNIKIALLSSAAVLFPTACVLAADAVVAPEPEPTEYVRICDMYGTGYYYIPGSEICLKAGGYLMTMFEGGPLLGDDTDGDGKVDSWQSKTRMALRMDARTETELGTLRGFVEMRFFWASSDGGAPGAEFHPVGNSEALNDAWVKLGGVMVGVSDSMFMTWVDYAADVVHDDLLNYGPWTTHQISYTFDAGNGFSAIAGVEEGNDGDSPFGGAITDYAPDVVLGAKYKNSLLGLYVLGAWDSNADEYTIRGKVSVTPNDRLSLFVLGSWTDDRDDNGGNWYANWGGDWEVVAGGGYKFTDRFTLNGEFTYTGMEEYGASLEGLITIVPGLNARPGIAYAHHNSDFPGHTDEDAWGGYLRTTLMF